MFKTYLNNNYSPGDAADGEKVPCHLRGLYEKYRNIIKSADDANAPSQSQMNHSIQNAFIGNLTPIGANPNAPSRSSVNRDNVSAGLVVANPQKRKLSQKSAMVILDNGDETDPKTPKKGEAKGNAKGNSMEKKMEFQNNMLNTFRLTQEANTAHATSRNDIAQKNFAFKEKSYNNQLKIQDNKQKLSEWKATKRFDLEEKKMVQKKQERCRLMHI